MNNYTHKGEEGIFLVNYHDNSDIETDFDYNGTNLKDGYKDILTYMQGDASNIVGFSSDTRYFYSDNMLAVLAPGCNNHFLPDKLNQF